MEEEFIEIARGLWYETSTGLPWTTRKPGGSKGWIFNAPLKRLNYKNKHNYYMVKLDGKLIYWHRLVYKFFHGFIPREMQIDHRNNKRDDNRIENLQILFAKQNYRCQLKNRTNSSGFPGVYFYRRNEKWAAQIKINGIRKYLGHFDTPKEAYKAYIAAKIKYHGRESIRVLSIKDE